MRSSKATNKLFVGSLFNVGFIGVLSLGVVGGAGAGFLKFGITINFQIFGRAIFTIHTHESKLQSFEKKCLAFKN